MGFEKQRIISGHESYLSYVIIDLKESGLRDQETSGEFEEVDLRGKQNEPKEEATGAYSGNALMGIQKEGRHFLKGTPFIFNKLTLLSASTCF